MKKFYLIFTMVFVVTVFAVNCMGEPLSPKLAKAKVKAAAELLKDKGDAAIPAIKDPNGEFRFADRGEGYIWIHNLEGIMIMHPTKPSLDGKPLFGIKDPNGVYLFVNMNEIVEEKGAGWVGYAWPKPGADKTSPKMSYVILVHHGEKSYVAGCGIYDVTAEDIKKEFPDDPIYED